jgi:putative FmdB family regulatory protein
MPLYEYECQKCAKVTEVLQKISDPAPKACAHCKKGPLKKIMSRTVFKDGRCANVDELPGRDLVAEHNASLESTVKEGNYIIDDTGHRVEVDADDPRLKTEKAS